MCAKPSKIAPAPGAQPRELPAAAKAAAERGAKRAAQAAAPSSRAQQPAAGPSRPAAAAVDAPAKAAASTSESGDDSDADSDASSSSTSSSSAASSGGGDDILQRTALSLASHPLPATKMLSRTLARFTQLARLDLSDMKPSDDSPRGLVDLEWLAAATGDAKAKRRAPDAEHFGKRLTWLSVANNEGLSGEGALNGVETLRNLYVLNATGCGLRQLPVALLPQSLRALILNSNALTSIPALPHFPELNTLALSHNGLKSLPASLCASMPQLKKISLSQNALTSAALPDLSPLSHLREVRLAGNKLGRLPAHLRTWGKGVGSAARGTGLETLELGDCGLERWEDIAPLLEKDGEAEQDGKRSKGLKNLTLKGNGVALLEGYKEKIIAAHPSLLVLDGFVLQPRAPKRPQAIAPQQAAAERDGDEAGPSRREHDGPRSREDAAGRRQDRAGPPPQEDGGERRRRDRAGPPPSEDDGGRRRRDRAGPPPEEDGQERRRDRAGPAPGSSGAHERPRKGDKRQDSGTANARSKRTTDAAAADEERSKPHKRGGRGKKHHVDEPAAKPAPAPAPAPLPPPVEGVFEDDEKRSRKKRAKRGRKEAEEAEVLQDGEDAAEQTPRKKRKEDKPKKPKVTAPAWDADSPLVATPAPVPEPEPEAPKTSVAAVIEVRKKGGKKGLPPAPQTALPAWSADEPWGAGAGGDAWGAGESAW